MKIARLLKMIPVLLATAVFLAGVTQVHAQSASSPAELALGGGSALLTGSASVFQNPANILVKSHRFERELMLGSLAITFPAGSDPLFPLDPAKQVRDYFLPHAETTLIPASAGPMDMLSTRGDAFEQYVQYQAVPMTLVWHRGASARSLAVRSRGVAAFEMSKNWLQNSPNDDHDRADLSSVDSGGWNHDLHERYQVLHEISIGFAREVTMFNQWKAGLNTLLIGLAPKVIFAGMHSDMSYRSTISPANGVSMVTTSLHGHTTGSLTGIWSDAAAAGNAQGLPAANERLGPSANRDIQGFGFGLDAGMTYIIPIGGDISLSPHVRTPLRKSIRLSLALTDIGFVHYTGTPARWESDISEEIETLPDPAASGFAGKPGEMVQFLRASDSSGALFTKLIKTDNQPYSLQLPTRLQLGAAIQYLRFSAAADLTYEHNAGHFLPRGWIVSTGAQIYLLRFLPVYGSLQREPSGSIYYGLGAGLDFGRMELSAAARLYNDSSQVPEWLNRELAVMAMRIRW